MLELTEKARTELVEYFKDKEKPPIRIFLSPGGWSGPRLSLALDEQRDNDEVFDMGDEFTFVVEKDLYDNAKPITVDLGFTGFVVESNLPMMGGGCSSGSCGPSAGGSCAC